MAYFFGQTPTTPQIRTIIPIPISYGYPYGQIYQGGYTQPQIPVMPERLMLPPGTSVSDLIPKEPNEPKVVKESILSKKISFHIPTAIITLLLVWIFLK